jgi:two-component system chemotaxis sensor kinase CheA
VNEPFSQDPSLVQDFIVESEEFLASMDQDMVALESAGDDHEILDRIFRAMHTIKGTAGFLGFDPIARLSHRAEDVLSAMRRGEAQLDRRGMDALLAARDRLGAMLEDLRQGGLKQYNLDSLLADLQDAQKLRRSPPTLGELLVKDSVITPDTLGTLLSEQAASAQPRRLGELLVEKGLSTPEQIGHALARQKEIAESQSLTGSMRVDAKKLDDLINLIGELVLERNRLLQLSRDCSARKVELEDLDAMLAQSSARLSLITDELQSAGLKTRMVPIESVLRRFPRLVRDVAGKVQKEVQLEMHGQDTEVDKTMVELIADPLMHLVRNAVDHGIEAPEVRERAGKPRRGAIHLEARHEGDQIVICISDDGAGISPDRIGSKAVEKGLISAEKLRLLAPRQILDFIFLPGFTTAERTSDISGRGVGLDVVRSNLKKLNGSVELDSRPGVGTTLLLRLPLTLAILPVLLVGVAEEVYALPVRSVIETAKLYPQHIHTVEGREVIYLRGETLPLIRLEELFARDDGSTEIDLGHSGKPASGNFLVRPRKVVILGVAEKRIAVLVDQVLGQEAIVVKPLGSYLHGCAGFAGATISGDGSVRLVLDPPGLLEVLQAKPPLHRKASA